MKYLNIFSLTLIQTIWLVSGVANAQSPGGDPLYKAVDTPIMIKEPLRVRNEETTYAPYPEISSNQPLTRIKLKPEPEPAPQVIVTPPVPKMEVIAPPPIPARPEVIVTRPAPTPKPVIAPPPIQKPVVTAPSIPKPVVQTPARPTLKTPPIVVTTPSAPTKPVRIDAPKPYIPPVKAPQTAPQVPVAVVVTPPTRPVVTPPAVNQFPRTEVIRPATPLIQAKPVVPTPTVVANIPSIAPPQSSSGPSLTILRTSAHLLARQGVPYRFGRSHPAFGGLDSPGAVQYLLNEIGVQGVPRSTADLSNWIRVNNLLREFPNRPSVLELTNHLYPGNLIFWGDTDSQKLTDVMIYLGYDTSRSRHLAFGTRGGTERGLNGNEVDIFDLKLDRERIVSTGSIPGISMH